MRARTILLPAIILMFLSATPAFACMGRNDYTVALPVFLVLLLIKSLANLVMAYSQPKWPSGFFGGMLLILGAMAQLYELVYAWVLYENLMLCVEFLARQEDNLKEFYFNHAERVWTAGLLITGGIAAKLLYYSQQGWWFFTRIYSEYAGYFTFYLIAASLLFLFLLYLRKLQNICRVF